MYRYVNILIVQFKFAGNVGDKAINLFQFNLIVNSAKKRGARGNCPVCPLLNPALHVDICGCFPPSQTYTHLLECVDRFSRWVEAYPMPDQTINFVICAFNKHLQTFGACSVIHSDSGCQSTSAAFRDYCQFIGTNHRISSVRYPQSNGLAERMIRRIETALTAKLDTNHWTYHLPFVILSLNSIYKEDLKCCSAELVAFAGVWTKLAFTSRFMRRHNAFGTCFS